MGGPRGMLPRPAVCQRTVCSKQHILEPRTHVPAGEACQQTRALNARSHGGTRQPQEANGTRQLLKPKAS